MSSYYRQVLTVDTFERYLRKQFLDSVADPMLSYIDDDQGSTPEKMSCPWGRGEEAGYQQELREILGAPLGASQNMDHVVNRDLGYLEGFNKHFGQVENELWALHDQVDAEIKQADATHLDTEREYHADLKMVAVRSEEAFNKFKDTHLKLQEATANATRISVRLESHEEARMHADRALKLIQHLKQFQANAMQDSIFDEPTEESCRDMYQLYQMSGDLMKCQDADSVEARKLKEVAGAIVKKHKLMTKMLNSSFDKAHLESDHVEMVRCAHLLVEYFDAESFYTRYIKKNCTLINSGQGQAISYNKYQDVIQWGAKDPQEAFDKEVRDAIFTGSKSFDSEYQLIRRIFPEPAQVMKKLVEALFLERIQKFVNALKDACSDPDIVEQPERALLEVTAVAYASIQQIELRLQPYNLADLDVHSLTLKLFPELKGVAAGSTGEQDYIDREMKCLEEVLRDVEKTAVEREKNMAEALGENILSGIKLDKSSEQDNLLLLVMQSSSAIQMVDQMIDETLASVKRSNQLSPEAERQGNAEGIIDYFLGKIKKNTMKALAMAKDPSRLTRGGKQKSVTEFAKFFTLARQVNRIVSTLRGKFGSFIKVRFSEWHRPRDRILATVEDFIQSAEVEVGEGLKISLEGMIERVKKRLANMQTPSSSDYLKASDGNHTTCCTKVCEILSKQFQFITASLQGKVLHRFLRSFASHLYKIFVEHFITLKFSAKATIEIKSDVKRYTDVITQNIHDPDIVTKIMILNDLVTVFLVGKESVEFVMKEKLSMMDKHMMKRFVACRADYEENEQFFTQMFEM